MEHRYLPMENMTTREEGDDLYLEGYFAVFNGVYELWPGATESIAPGAFDDSVGDDVRALFNHNTDLVLGRTSAGTLELRQDAHGLWGPGEDQPGGHGRHERLPANCPGRYHRLFLWL